MDTIAAQKKNKQEKKKVDFELFAPEAQKVTLAGDFNQWKPEATPLEKKENGKWKVTLNLAPGRYEYRFLVDGDWQNDPQSGECVPNAFGSWNSVLEVR